MSPINESDDSACYSNSLRTCSQQVTRNQTLNHKIPIPGIVVNFGKKTKHFKKVPFQRKKSTFLAKKHPFHEKKALLEQKKTLSKHYFITKKQQESTYN